MPGGILALSSDQQRPGSVILWVSIPKGGEGEAEDAHTKITGRLLAYAAELPARGFTPVPGILPFPPLKLLWEYTLDDDSYIKYVPPTIANGKVYIAERGKVAVFGVANQ